MERYFSERLALMNALGHAGLCYLTASERLAPLQPLLRKLGEERLEAAQMLKSQWSLDFAGPALEPADADDALRRAISGLPAVVELVRDEERTIRETVEDMSDDMLDEIARGRLLAMLDEARANLLHQPWTGGNAGEAERFGLEFAIKSHGLRLGPAAAAPARVFRLWYGTNRNPVYRAEALTGFDSKISDDIHTGQCEVVIPQAHKIGSTGSRWWYRILRGDDRLKLATVTAEEPDAFWKSIREQISGTAGSGDAVVFIHGYNLRFEDAAIRAAQIGADLAIPNSVMAFFSWPSRGRLLGYTADESSIEASEGAIGSFLADFALKSGAGRVHIIAHSMGNRGLLRAVTRITDKAAAQTGKTFGQIILAAPDVNTRLFRDLAVAYQAVAARTTLYVSAGDLAVLGSRILHGADRIGFTPPIAIVDGIDTINVTGVDMTLLGHGYVGECRPVLHDMFELLVRGSDPDKRAMLRPQMLGGRPYWEIAA